MNIPTYEELEENGNKKDSDLEGTCFLYEYKGKEYVVLQDNSVITKEEDAYNDSIF